MKQHYSLLMRIIETGKTQIGNLMIQKYVSSSAQSEDLQESDKKPKNKNKNPINLFSTLPLLINTPKQNSQSCKNRAEEAHDQLVSPQ